MQQVLPLVRVTSQSSDLPVSLEEAKQKLAIYHDDLDQSVNTNLLAAIETVEEKTGRLLRVSSTVVESYPRFTADCLSFTRNPVKSVTSVEYYPPQTASLSTVSSSEYRLGQSDKLGAVLEFDDNYNYPDTDERIDAVQVTYVAGYDAADLPAAAKAAVLLQLELLFGDADPRHIPHIERSLSGLIDRLQWSHYR